MTEKTKKKVPSLGHKLLCDLPDTGVNLAAFCGVSPAAVSSWRTGSKTPDDATRARLVEKGVPLAAWETSPRRPKTPTSPDTRLPSDPNVGATPTLQDICELIAATQATRREPGLTPTARSRLISDEVKLQSLRAKIERDEPVTIDRIIRHPKYVVFRERLGTTLVEALKPHPEAMQAVMTAMRTFDVEAAS